MKRRKFIGYLSLTALPTIWACSTPKKPVAEGCWICLAALYRVTPGQKMYSEPGGAASYLIEKQQVVSWEKIRPAHHEPSGADVEGAKRAMLDTLAEKLSQAKMNTGVTVRGISDDEVIPHEGAEKGPSQKQMSIATLAVFFSFDKHALSDKEKSSIKQFVSNNDVYKANRWVLVGRADKRGTDAYNLELSRKRANQVKTYLQEIGVDTAVVDLQAAGEIGADESSKSRRVDIEVRK